MKTISIIKECFLEMFPGIKAKFNEYYWIFDGGTTRFEITFGNEIIKLDLNCEINANIDGDRIAVWQGGEWSDFDIMKDLIKKDIDKGMLFKFQSLKKINDKQYEIFLKSNGGAIKKYTMNEKFENYGILSFYNSIDGDYLKQGYKNNIQFGENVVNNF